MNSVITAEQAKKITGGRTPLVPVEYEAAVTALQACVTLDEAKYWSDKADALAAWAKIYRDDKAGLEAKRVKLHAYRRMGLIAHELRPNDRGREGKILAGPVSLLKDSGLKRGQAHAASRISKMDEQAFRKAVESPRPPSPSRLLDRSSPGSSESWKELVHGNMCLSSFLSFCRRYSAKDLAGGLFGDESEKAKRMAQEASDWLDEFDAGLRVARKTVSSPQRRHWLQKMPAGK